jgi:hypothetical protein
MLSRPTRAVLDAALQKYRPGRSDLILVGGISLLKPALRLMTAYRLVIEDVVGSEVLTSYSRWLVSCPRNMRYFAGSQVAVFPGVNDDPYRADTGRESNAEKQPTGSGKVGCDENWSTAALLVGHVSIQTRSLLAPCRRPILIATKYLIFRGQGTRLRAAQGRPKSRSLRSIEPAIRTDLARIKEAPPGLHGAEASKYGAPKPVRSPVVQLG